MRTCRVCHLRFNAPKCPVCADDVIEQAVSVVAARDRKAKKVQAEVDKVAVAITKSLVQRAKLKERERLDEGQKDQRDAEEAARKEYASRALARVSLLHYIERKVPKYEAGWVHEDVARRIERFMEAVDRQESPRLMLFMPPRMGKSELASDSGPAWILGQRPDWTFILSSYSEELPLKFSRNIREQLKSEEFQTLFPNGAILSKSDQAAQAWSTEQGGEVRAAGAGGSILGFGAHIFIIDDPIKGAEEADNAGHLAKVFDWATSTAYSRLAPGGGILIIQQRWSEEDPSGRFEKLMEGEEQMILDLRASADELSQKPDRESQEEADRYMEEAEELEKSMDKWEIVSYAALAEADEYLTPEGDIVQAADDVEVGADWRLLRQQGEALHPERYSRLQYLKIKRANPRRFAAMYQQHPQVDEGEYFSRSDFKRYDKRSLPDLCHLRVLSAWDLALGTREVNDHTVGLAAGMDHNGDVWLLDRKRGKWGDIDKIADLIIDMHVRNESAQTGVERTHMEMALMPVMRRKMRKRKQWIAMAEGKESLKPVADKRARARQFQALCRAGKVHVPVDDGRSADGWDNFIDILVRFGSSKIDDDVDAAAWLGIMFGRTTPPEDPKSFNSDGERKKSWHEELLEKLGLTSSERDFMSA